MGVDSGYTVAIAAAPGKAGQALWVELEAQALPVVKWRLRAEDNAGKHLPLRRAARHAAPRLSSSNYSNAYERV